MRRSSGFAITAYTVRDEIGGDAALAQFREQLAQRDIKLMLDFVPNHTAPDHPWVNETHRGCRTGDAPRYPTVGTAYAALRRSMVAHIFVTGW